MKKSAAYRLTFRRHRRLLTLPVVLAVILATWTSFGHPKSYESTASLWVDNPASAQSSLGNLNPAEVPPAQQEQQVLMELLTTRNFMTNVANRSGLAKYLGTQPSEGFGPTALLSKLTGPKSVHDQVVSALGPKHVATVVPGPQVLQISYTAGTAAIARSTLQAIVTGLQQDSASLSQRHNKVASDYYRSQVAAASKTLAGIRDQIAAYTRSHRGRNAADPNLAALQTAEAAANGQLNDANSNLSEATGAAQAGSTGSAVHVIDAPTVPLGPTSGMKRRVMAIFGGLFAGLLISFLAVVVLTPTRRDPWEDEPPAADWQGRAVAGGHATNGVDVRRPNAAWITTGAGALFVAPEADRDSRDHP